MKREAGCRQNRQVVLIEETKIQERYNALKGVNCSTAKKRNGLDRMGFSNLRQEALLFMCFT